ncbi:MAG TPA: ComEC/Rec2 family competence protein [Terriglobales bacterium]|nr:ComEC/Rec2 family competence protein [Terriglobales bacterium]
MPAHGQAPAAGQGACAIKTYKQRLKHPNLNTRQPLLYAALAFSGGIVFGRYCWRPAAWWIIAAVMFGAGAVYFLKRRPRMAPLIAIGVWFCLGSVNLQVHRRPPIPDISRFADQNEILITAHVIHEGYLREAGFGGLRQQIDVETEDLQTDSEISHLHFRIRLGVFAKQSGSAIQSEDAAEVPMYRYGERLQFLGRLREPHNYGNPGSFDYRTYLQDNGISALGSTKVDTIEILPGFSGNRLEAARSRIHRRIVDEIHALWPPREAALMDAAVIGEDAFLFRSTRVDFQRSGTYHILVVSGMNVSILAFVIGWALRRFRLGEILASFLTIVLTVAYASLTYVGPPVWRATLMMACYLMTRLVYRDRSMLNALGAAALVIMVLDPSSLLGASFQLTFLSVLIVAALAIPILERTSQPYRRSLRHLETKEVDPSLGPKLAQFRVDLRMIARRLGRFTGNRPAMKLLTASCGAMLGLGEVLLVSALMQVGLALPMAWYFHRVTVVALAANALAVPLTELLMPSAVLALGLGFITPVIAKIPALIAACALKGITATVVSLGNLRLADLRVPTPPCWLAVCAAAALASSMILVRRRTVLASAGVGAVLVTAACIALLPPKPLIRAGLLEVTSIDVGQGDSTLIVTPQGRTILVDAGGTPGAGHSNFDIGEDVISPYLWSRGFSRLDIALVTHGHWDHVGGMRAVLANFHPREVWVGANSPTESLAALLAYAHERKMLIRNFGEGDRVDYGGLAIHFLAPAKDNKHRRLNDDCLAMKLVFDRNSLLMEGDAEKAVERSIAQQEPSAELLKVGHHGSATSTSPELLAAVHPRLAVISVGRQNSYGHPRYEVLQRLATSAVKVYRTDVDGLVTFYVDGKLISPALR